MTSLKPVAALPGVPTLDAAGVPGYQTLAWFGFMVQAGTPVDVVRTLHDKTADALGQDEVKATLAKLGAAPSGLGPAEFAAHVKSETAKYARIIRDAGVSLDWARLPRGATCRFPRAHNASHRTAVHPAWRRP